MATTRLAQTADIDERATIGDGSSVWHLAQVREGATLGEGCVIGRGAYIGTGVRMGRNCKVQNYALVYEPAHLGDGVFVGPSDFSIALSHGARVDPGNKEMLKAAAEIAAKTTKAGKIPCTLGYTGEAALAFREMGFRLIAIGSDISYLTAGANAAVAEAAGG